MSRPSKSAPSTTPRCAPPRSPSSKKLKAARDPAKVAAALDALKNGARGDANLLALAIDAARARATVGEISAALEEVFGRHKAEIRSLSGVYGEDFLATGAIIAATSKASPKRWAAAPACWWPRWARTAMTAAPR